MKAVDHKCPSCNASIAYSPKLKKWKCDYCGSVFTLKELEKNQEKFEKNKVDKSVELKEKKSIDKAEYDEYQCNNCGAVIVADINTAATFCVYCKNTAILKSRLTDKFAPSKIIPFKYEKNDAVEAFKKVGKGKFLMPKEFADPKNIEELTGIYIPFWLHSCVVDSNVVGNGDRITSWRMGDYLYTKTDTYHVERNTEYSFENVPVDGSKRFDDATMNSIEPFDYKEMEGFNSSYLSGFLAEKYDVLSDEAKKKTTERVFNTSDSYINRMPEYNLFRKTSGENITKMEDLEYVLLPVWMVNIKYKDEFYTFAMNGQTGKMIGNIPYSKSKMFIFLMVLFIVLFAITALITYFV